MKERESLLQRWSRRKRAAAPADAADPESKPAHENPAAPPTTPPVPAELPFDVSKLPPLESITAETDIRAYLAPGVPAELTRAALRRAWTADPKIRDFVGLAENSWDFNTPESIPGFGPLQLTDELRRQIAGMVGRSLGDAAEPAPEAPAPAMPESTLTPPAPENSGGTAENASRPGSGEVAAAQQDPEPEQGTKHKRHGRGLPI